MIFQAGPIDEEVGSPVFELTVLFVVDEEVDNVFSTTKTEQTAQKHTHGSGGTAPLIPFVIPPDLSGQGDIVTWDWIKKKQATCPPSSTRPF